MEAIVEPPLYTLIHTSFLWSVNAVNRIYIHQYINRGGGVTRGEVGGEGVGGGGERLGGLTYFIGERGEREEGRVKGTKA